MKKIYERPEADVVLLLARESLAVIPGTDENAPSPLFETELENGVSAVGGVGQGSGRA